MKRCIVISLLLLTAAGCGNDKTSQLIPGRWSFAADVAEYHGLYVFDFRKDGLLVLEDYAEGFKTGDRPSSTTQVGRYSFIGENQISIQDTNREERAAYKIDEEAKRLLYLRGVEKGDIQLVRLPEHRLLYDSR